MRTATTYDKLVGRIGSDYYFCDDIFKYDDSLQGATGTVLTPVSRDEYDETTSEEGLVDRLGEYWQMAVADGKTEQSKADWCQMVYRSDGDEAIYDFSGYDLWNQLRDIGLTEDEIPVFTCVGGGRSFSKDMVFDEVYDKALLAKIRHIEN